MSIKKFLLYVLAVFLLLILNFAVVYEVVAILKPGGFPIVGSECSTIALALLTLELLLWWFVDYRRNRQAYQLPPYTPAQKDGLSDVSILSPTLHPFRSGAEHSAPNARPNWVLAPLAGSLAFALGCIAAVYFGFHFFVFDHAYRGDPAVFGQEYQDADVTTNLYDRQFNREIFVLETADGEQRVLAFDSSDLHPGRYRNPPSELYGVPNPNSAVQTPYRNFWAWLEIWLILLVGLAALAVSVFLSRRVRQEEHGDEKRKKRRNKKAARKGPGGSV